MKRLLWLWLVVALASAQFVRADSTATDPAAVRAAFLKLIDRPRVPLAPELKVLPETNGLVTTEFTYASDADQRVPGLIVKSATATGKQPTVIVLHGTGGKKEGEMGLLKKFAQKGFIAVAIDGRYHGARSSVGSGTRDYFAAILKAYRTGKEHPLYYDTVWDVMRLIDYLDSRDDVDAKRIGMTGFSKGGIETYFTSAVDTRIAVSVPCIGVQCFRWGLDNDMWQQRIATVQGAADGAAADEGVTIDAAFARKFLDRLTPGIYGQFDGPIMLTLITPRPLLVINGGADAHTPLPGLRLCEAAAKTAYTQASVPEKFNLIVEENTGHKVNDAAQAESFAWFEKYLKP